MKRSRGRRPSSSLPVTAILTRNHCLRHAFLFGLKRTKKESLQHQNSATPPTTEAFQENVKRAHNQAIIWRSLDSDDVPDLDPETFGWKKNMSTKSLTPVAIPESVPLAVDYLLKLICCGCSSQNPCSKRCSCKSAGYPRCSVFCVCYSVGCSR